MTRAESLLSTDALRRWATGERLSSRERILLALRWFDWVSAADVYDALNADTPPERRNLSGVLWRMFRDGELERRDDRGVWMYRTVKR